MDQQTALKPVEDPLGGDAGGLEGRVGSPEERQQGELILVRLMASFQIMWITLQCSGCLPATT
jgi:hypothetical protein